MGHTISTPKVPKMAEYKQGIMHQPCPPSQHHLPPTLYIIYVHIS